MMADEFYIGYRAAAPPRLARFVRRLVFALAAAGLSLAIVLASRQVPFDAGTFEVGLSRNFSGRLAARPYSQLLVDRPGTSLPGSVGVSRYWLVDPGKISDSTELEEHDGQAVELGGSLIFNENSIMIEVDGEMLAPIEDRAEPRAPNSSRELGVQTLVGEIVDAKCFLGVMKPGRGKSHRACASLCIRGGIPPMLLVESVDGQRVLLLLIDEAGHAVNDRILDHVAEPVQITGRVRREDDALYLIADPGTYKRAM